MAAAVSSPASGDMALDLAAPFLPEPPSGFLLHAETAAGLPQEEADAYAFPPMFDDDPQNANSPKRTGHAAGLADRPGRPADDAKRRRGEEKKANSENWEHMHRRLVNYKLVHGDTLVPKRYTADPKLGTWVETQRVQYKKLQRAVDERSGVELVAPNNRLTPLRLEKLNAIGFAWTAKPVRRAGDAAAPTTAAAAAARQGEGLASVPTVHGKLRESASNSRPSNRQSEDTAWEDMYQRLVQFQQREGHCVVPRKYEADPKLAAWVEQQRTMWNRQKKAHGNASLDGALGNREVAAHMSGASDSSSDRLDELVGAADDPALDYTEAHRGGEVVDDVLDVAELPVPDLGNSTMPTASLSTEQALTEERKARLDALGFVWSLRSKRVEDHWDGMFQQLVQYKQVYGDCLVPSRWDANPKLGKWIETQRYEYTKMRRSSTDFPEAKGSNGQPKANTARLTQDRIRRLESIGFEWKVKHKMKKYYDKQWDMMFERLLQFKNENGHCMVPKRYSVEPKLGVWVHTQRIQYRKLSDKKNSKSDGASSDSAEEQSRDLTEEEISVRLTDDRRRRLEEIGFIWNAREGDRLLADRVVRNSYDEQWDAMFNRLKAYKEKYGHCLVPKRCQDDARLGTWVDTQRVQYKKMKKRRLGLDDAATVEASNRNGQLDDANQERILSLGLNSAGSVARPLDTRKSVVGRLTDERIRRLDNLGFVWSLRDDWNKHYEELRVFRREHGHCNVPARYAKNRRLGIWVSSQRQQYKLLKSSSGSSQPQRSSPLTQERIDLLNQLGFAWIIRSRDTENEAWAHRYQQLVKFKLMNGHCNVPVRSGELGIWTNTQRTQYRQYMRLKETGEPSEGLLSINEDRIRQLEAIGFVWFVRETKRDADSLGYHKVTRPGTVPDNDSQSMHPESTTKYISSVDHQVQTENEYHVDDLL